MINSVVKPGLNYGNRKNAFLLLALIITAFVFIGGFSLILLIDDNLNPFKDMFLLPWVVLAGIVISAPGIYLKYKGSFDLFHPLVFAAWSYFLPAFFLGGLILASRLSQPFFLSFIENERYNLPLTLFYVALGFASLSCGFFLSMGKKLGDKLFNKLPVANWQARQLIVPGLLILLIGIFNTIFAFGIGILGYQRLAEIGAFDGLIFLFTLFWLEASFILWLSIFKTRKLNINHFFVAGFLIFVSFTKAAYQGNRGSLFQVFILIACAFIYSEREIKFKHKLAGGILLVATVLVGMIYGTTFRNLKGTENSVSMSEYTEVILSTFDKVIDQDLGKSVEEALTTMAERLESVSSLAVVVSNYEKLQPYEESYGIENNIWKDSITFFIPRPLWQDKPVGSDPRKYSDLYFNFNESSFSITPIGDLLRNFGPLGIVLGMLFLGMIIRFIYAALIEDKPFSYWRTTIYYMILTGISYEGFFGTIIPYIIKITVISSIGILCVWFFIKKDSNFTANTNSLKIN